MWTHKHSPCTNVAKLISTFLHLFIASAQRTRSEEKYEKPNNRPKAVISIVKLVTCCQSETCGIELCLSPRKDSYIYLGVKGTARDLRENLFT